MNREINLEEKFKHLTEQYKLLEDIHNDTVKQYNHLVQRYDNIITITRRYSDRMEYCINVLEEDNRKLKERELNG